MDPILGSALIGFAGSLFGGRSRAGATAAANAANLEQVRLTNRANRKEARKARKFTRRQVREARKYDARQIRLARRYEREENRKTRRYNRRMAERADKRSRRRALRDRADHRAYNDPAAVRARLEAAGLNPLSGVDGSGAFIPGGSVITPGDAGPASAVGYATSGIAPTAFAEMIPGQVMPVDQWGGVEGAFDALANGFYKSLEYDLRETQLEMEAQRLQQIVQRATINPVVGGVYGRGNGGTGYANQSGQAGPTRPPVDLLGFPDHGAARTSVDVAGTEIAPHPGFSDAEALEQRYGDGVSLLYGFGVGSADMGYTFGKWLREDVGPWAASAWQKATAALPPIPQADTDLYNRLADELGSDDPMWQ